MIAALLISGAAICAVAQSRNGAVKQNTREQATKVQTPTSTTAAPSAEDASYSYEFQKSDFFIRHIVIKHNATGHGEISFERQGDIEPIVEPFELSASAWTRIAALWGALAGLSAQVLLTGTDPEPFAALRGQAEGLQTGGGTLRPDPAFPITSLGISSGSSPVFSGP